MLTTQERINQIESPVARELLQNLHDELAEAIIVPNDMLPEEFQQHKEFDTGSIGSDDGKIYGSSIADINRKLKAKEPKTQELSQVEKDRAERAWRIEKYINQIDGPTDEQLQYIEDDARLYRNQVTFLNLMIQQGVINAEEFEED